jgi:apolipoprotein N-acyltransferase
VERRPVSDGGTRPERGRVAHAGATANTVASAVLFGASFPPWELQALAWVALAPLLVALRSVGHRAALGLALLWALLASLATGTWFVGSVAAYFEQPYLVGVGLFVFTVGTMAGPYYVAFAACYVRFPRRFGRSLPLLAAAAWVAIELGRGRLLTGSALLVGNPWALIGYSQVGLDTVLQIASVTGIYGVSFVVVATNAGLAELWLAWRRGGGLRRGGAAILVGGAPAVFALLFGWSTLARVGDELGEPFRVAVVQGDIDSGSRWRPDLYGSNLRVYLRLTRDTLSGAAADVVVWPEAAMTFFVDAEPVFRRAIARELKPSGAELVAGAPREEPGPEGPLYYNSVFLLDAEGDIRGRYDKQYRVPFTEYFPLRVDLLRRRFGRTREFERGEPTPPLPTRAGAAGVLICNEGMLPEVAAARVADGAAYLVSPSNDSWISDRGFAEMQFDIVSVRAIEQRRYLVRASTSGPSAIVDPWGRERGRTEPMTQRVLRGEVRSRSDRSIYGRVGDAFALACTLVAAVALLRSIRR